MTEGNETITLHSETLDKIQSLLFDEAVRTGNPTLESMRNTIMAQRSGHTPERLGPSSVGFCGLPGAGKSSASSDCRDEKFSFTEHHSMPPPDGSDDHPLIH